MKGRWAAGIVPRNFAWIVKERLAVSERPGGYAPHHRPVRRQEEILWLSHHGFTRVVSLLPSSHNLRAYEDLSLPSAHFPLPAHDDIREPLAELYRAMLGWLRKGDRLLVHQEELGERLSGVMAGFLYWSGIIPEPPQAISAVEALLRRQLGSAGRSIVAQSMELQPPLDEYGVPLARRTVVIEASLLGVPNATSLTERAKTSSRNENVHPSGASVLTSVGSEEKQSIAKTNARASAPKVTEKVAAIRPIKKGTKIAPEEMTGAKSGQSTPAKKRTPPASPARAVDRSTGQATGPKLKKSEKIESPSAKRSQ